MRKTASAFLLLLILAPTAAVSRPYAQEAGRRITCRELFTGIGAPSAAHPVPNATVVNVRLEANTLVADIAGSQPVRSNHAADIVAAILKTRQGVTGPVYVDATALEQNRRAALEKSFEVVNRDSKLPLRYVDGIHTLFEPDAARESLAVVETGSDGKGQHYQRADMKVGGESFAMTVYCRVKEAVQAFFDKVKAHFGKPSGSESTIAVINRVRREVAMQFHLSDDELRVRLKAQLGTTQWVMAERPAEGGRGE